MKKLILSMLMVAGMITISTAAFAGDLFSIPGLSGVKELVDITSVNPRNGVQAPVTIPKNWKFIGTIGTSLLFMGDDGVMYLLVGAMDGGAFYASGLVQRLPVK